MMNDKIKNMNDMTKDEIFNAIRIIAEKTGVVIVDAAKINDIMRHIIIARFSSNIFDQTHFFLYFSDPCYET